MFMQIPSLRTLLAVTALGFCAHALTDAEIIANDAARGSKAIGYYTRFSGECLDEFYNLSEEHIRELGTTPEEFAEATKDMKSSGNFEPFNADATMDIDYVPDKPCWMCSGRGNGFRHNRTFKPKPHHFAGNKNTSIYKTWKEIQSKMDFTKRRYVNGGAIDGPAPSCIQCEGNGCWACNYQGKDTRIRVPLRPGSQYFGKQNTSIHNAWKKLVSKIDYSKDCYANGEDATGHAPSCLRCEATGQCKGSPKPKYNVSAKQALRYSGAIVKITKSTERADGVTLYTCKVMCAVDIFGTPLEIQETERRSIEKDTITMTAENLSSAVIDALGMELF